MGRGANTTLKQMKSLSIIELIPNSKNIREELKVINKDLLPGQPEVNSDMLQQALQGLSYIDSFYWENLQNLNTIVAKESGKTVGILSYGVRKDNTGVILWSHTQENQQITEKLIQTALDSLQECSSIEAFSHASALGVGIEGLPNSRKTTDKVLQDNGFKSEDLWLYMNRKLSEKDIAPEHPNISITSVSEDEEIPDYSTYKLEYKENAQQIGTAEFSVNKQRAILWWIETEEKFKNKGVASEMLTQVLSLSADKGAKNIILYVDHDAPENSERDRKPAINMYKKQGWEIVDHLLSYKKEINNSV